jgi:hypothetical protein
MLTFIVSFSDQNQEARACKGHCFRTEGERMGKRKPTEPEGDSKKALPPEGETESRGVRRLTDQEILELRRDMLESSAWAKAELARRRKK